MEHVKKEEIVSERNALQIEQFVHGKWWLIYESSTVFTEDDVYRMYKELKRKYKDEQFRLLRWSNVVKYELIDGKGF